MATSYLDFCEMKCVTFRLAAWALFASGLVAAPPAAAADKWVGAWATAPMPPVRGVLATNMGLPKNVRGTFLYLIRPTLSGGAVRLTLSNETGDRPLQIGSVSIRSGTDRATSVPVTFNGARSVTIPAGAPLLSDPTSFDVHYGEDLLVSVYVPEGYVSAQIQIARSTLYVANRDDTAAPDLAGAEPIAARPIVTVVSVSAPAAARAIVALGDSITDGSGGRSTSLRGWPDALADRLHADSKASPLAVVNAGIAGNRLLSDGMGAPALARLDRDVLTIPGVAYVLLLEGINDIGMTGLKLGPVTNPPVEASMIIGAYRQIIERAHTRGLKIYGGTLLPFSGAIYFDERKERVRQEVNAWIRSSEAFDGVVDFDKAVRDEAHPERLKSDADSGDHLHPSDAGYQMMAAAVDLRLFDEPANANEGEN